MKWREVMGGCTIDDGSSLYIVDNRGYGTADFSQPPGWRIVERHIGTMDKLRDVSGPFPTLDGAKAAYIVLAPRYPGP